jgi:protoporphyrinogen/coproporphyrinogen III oxidase
MSETDNVIVVGGGIAGLTSAYALWKKRTPFTLLEASERLGGVIRSEGLDGFLLEAGPDAILAQKPEGLALCRELGLAPRLVPTNPEQRKVYVARHGRLHALPDGLMLMVPTRIWPFISASLFSVSGKLRMARDLVIARRRDGADESIADFMRRRFGLEALELLGEPLMAGIHSGDPERLSMRATFPRFIELEARYGSLIRGMLAARSKSRRKSGTAAFYSLQGGLSDLVSALSARLPSPSVRTGARVRQLAKGPGGFAVTLASGERLSARAVVVAVPTSVSAGLAQPLASDVAATLSAVPFVSTAAVYLGYARKDVRHALDGYGLLVPRSEGLRTCAWSFFSTKYPGRAPEGKVLLRAFLGGSRDPQILSQSDAQLIELARSDAGQLLGASGEPLLTRVYRWPEATPQMEVGHLTRVEQLDRRLSEIPGLFLTGAGLRSTGIPDGIADATRVAEAAAAFAAAS